MRRTIQIESPTFNKTIVDASKIYALQLNELTITIFLDTSHGLTFNVPFNTKEETEEAYNNIKMMLKGEE
jgi:hypothetical protein